MSKDTGRPGGLSSQATEPVPVSALRASIPDAVIDRLGEALSLMDEHWMTDNDRAAALVELWEAERSEVFPSGLQKACMAIRDGLGRHDEDWRSFIDAAFAALFAAPPAPAPAKAQPEANAACLAGVKSMGDYNPRSGTAQAIEARRAETAKTDSVEDESAVGNADAPNTSENSHAD